MADLGFAGARAVVDRAIDDQSAADAAAHVDPAHGVGAFARANGGFGQGGGVGVVLHGDGQAGQVAQPIAEREIGPAFDLVRAADGAGLEINRTAKADADGGGVFACEKFG